MESCTFLEIIFFFIGVYIIWGVLSPFLFNLCCLRNCYICLCHPGPHTIFSRRCNKNNTKNNDCEGENKGSPGNRIYLILESISQVFIPQILVYHGSRGNVLSLLENWLKNKGKVKQALLWMKWY